MAVSQILGFSGLISSLTKEFQTWKSLKRRENSVMMMMPKTMATVPLHAMKPLLSAACS